ncbi:BolA family protein [uncultured Psychrosphaera sp.]|jgi:acid stress-induced BolA-like protein IbaG/YrbA|uniref:BolA family protein n=1 Tax=uncultured Psychrosphaera sp. TaxID=1403522 RepID=UPI002622E044|nr:BolA family protein [uncultured Psychrosphaera sp.]
MELKDIEERLASELQLDEVSVKSDGSHFQIIAVGTCFEELSRVKQQQLVLKPLSGYIADGSMHAVSIKAYTPKAWARDKKLQQLS